MEKIDENDKKIETNDINKLEGVENIDNNQDINSTLKQMGDLLYNNKKLKKGEQVKDQYKLSINENRREVS